MVQTLANIPNSQARRNELHHRLPSLNRAQRLQLLCLTLDDPFPPIRQDVAQALKDELQASPGHNGALLRFLEATATGRAPAHDVTAALDIPRQSLAHDSERARMAACVALEGSTQPTETADVIRPLLRAESAHLRYQALIAVYRLVPGDRRLYDVVIEAMEDDDPEVAVVATQIAVKNAWTDLLPNFLRARARLEGEDRTQVTFSVGALIENSAMTASDLPPEARTDMIAECVDALTHEPHTAAASKTLARLEATEAEGALVDVTTKWFAHPILKVEAAAALVELGSAEGPKHLQKALNSRRKDARGYALRVVGTHRLPQFFDHLVDVATADVYHADTATLALADFGDERARQVLSQIADSHPQAEVRQLASDALRRGLGDQSDEPLFGTAEPAQFDATVDR